MKRKILIVCLLSYISLISAQCGGNHGRSVNHVVLIWLKDDQPQGLMSKIMTETINLRKIKTVKSIHIGRPIESKRDMVDSSFDLGIYMSFNSMEDMNTYLEDPRHIEFIKTNIEGKTKKLVMYDF